MSNEHFNVKFYLSCNVLLERNAPIRLKCFRRTPNRKINDISMSNVLCRKSCGFPDNYTKEELKRQNFYAMHAFPNLLCSSPHIMRKVNAQRRGPIRPYPRIYWKDFDIISD
jgi:hypothetical protein